MLKLNNIEVVYSNVILVLRGVSMEVAPGRIIALLGANGAGKTTTLKAVSGLLRIELGAVTDGSIEYDGQRIDKLSPEDIVRLGIIQVMEGRRLFDHLTVDENLRASAFVTGDSTRVKKDLDLVYNYFTRLKELSGRIAGYLSGGEQQMVVIGSAMMIRPKLVLLDEPSLGLSPKLVLEIFGIIKRINSLEKAAMVLVEQNARAALGIADYGYVMENGRIVMDGPAEKLKDNEDIKEFYLGLSQVGEKKSYREVKHYRRRKRWLA